MTPKELIAARRELALTQQKLGDELDMSRRWIGAMERGEQTIATTTELSVRYLLLLQRSGALDSSGDKNEC